MPYVLICRDAPGKLGVRQATREAHLAYAADSGLVSLAGPFLDEAGQMCGSLIVLAVEDREAAQAFADNDPYRLAGLFESVEILPWKRAIG